MLTELAALVGYTAAAPLHSPGFVSGPAEHFPVPGYTYDIMRYDGRMYECVRFRNDPQRPAGFYLLDHCYATLQDVFQYQLIRRS